MAHHSSDQVFSPVLEIGSSSGEGSTEAFVRGLRENASRATLFCMGVWSGLRRGADGALYRLVAVIVRNSHLMS